MTKPLPPILAVEDDPSDILFIRRALSKVDVANPLVSVVNGDELEAYLFGRFPYVDRLLPALVLLDVGLPRRTGLDLLEWIRKQRDLASLPVVMLSASDKAKDVNRAYELGANSYVVKGSGEILGDRLKALITYWVKINQPAKGS